MAKQSVITGALASVLGQASVLLLGYGTHLIIGRYLGPASYGIYGVILSIQTILGLLLTLGIPTAVARFVAQDEQHAGSILHQALRLQFMMAAVVSVVVLLLSVPLARLLGDEALVSYLRFTALVVFLQAGYPMYAQFFSGLHRFNRQALLTTIYAVAKFVGSVTLLFVFAVYGAFAGFAIGGCIALLLGWYWTRGYSGQPGHRLALKDFLSFAGAYVVILLSLQVLISLDLLMVKALLHDNKLAGYYNAAVTLSRISYQLLQAIGLVLLPRVSALTKPGASHDTAVRFIEEALRYLIIVIVPSVALAAATSTSLVRLFFSQRYLPAAPILALLMLGLGSLAFYSLLVTISARAGRTRVSMLATFALIALSFVLGLVFIPRFQLIGAAWQTTLAGGIGLIFMGVYTFRTFSLPVPWRVMLNVLCATAIAVAPTLVWHASPLLLPVQYVVLCLLFIATLLALKEITPADRQRIAALHPRLQWVA